MDKFKDRYRIPSCRLKDWDYRWIGAYFITICTQNREDYFGTIENGEMQLSQVGVIASIMWYEISSHSKQIELDAFVVMPNHIHGILIVNGLNLHSDVISSLSTQTIPNKSMGSISPKTDSISTIIRSYKSAVTKYAHRLGYKFEWQSRFYDHIIKDDRSYQMIQKYIGENPAKWVNDEYFQS
ncbi:MAG: transposase [Sphingobacteriia bacterium]|nr:transposase [Sphingobacteriia bacterium]